MEGLLQIIQRALIPGSLALCAAAAVHAQKLPAPEQGPDPAPTNSAERAETPATPSPETEEAKAEVDEAEIDIDGYGIFGNLNLKNLIKTLLPDEGEVPAFDANFVEDSAMLLMSRIQEDGFLDTTLAAHLILTNDQKVTYRWKESVEEPLPRPLSVKKLRFVVDKGPLFHYERIAFEGLETLPRDEALPYFIDTGGLIPLKKTRIYTPQRLDRAMANLQEALVRQGYRNATVTASETSVHRETGEARVTIHVEQGAQYIVRNVTEKIFIGSASQPAEVNARELNVPFSRIWAQDFLLALKRRFYVQGYPEATAEIKETHRQETNSKVVVDMVAELHTGPLILLNQVRFTGNEKTKRTVLRRQVDLIPQEPLNRIAAEEGRFELARLGIFDAVELEYESVDDDKRNVIYRLDEGKTIDFSLLFGWGSYEMARVGVELEQYNLFGRAHYSRLRAVQSLKSSRADYFYTMPELIGEDIDVFLTGSGLIREESSFTREEYGGGAGARRYMEALQSDLSVRYSYEVLNAAETDFALTEQAQRAGVASLIADLKHDQRDNPLYPRKGYKVFASLDLASAYLGGEVDYQRFEVAGSYHLPAGRGRWLHFGLTHGVITKLGGSEDDLPFNRRYFPGGADSIRGYQQGEATPLNAQGDVIGAETYLGGNLELEQALTPSWSVVGFLDAVGVGEELSDGPFDEILYSAGGGLRWKTLIGPVRLEYGYNLNRRKHDPAGTLHFSIGFPF